MDKLLKVSIIVVLFCLAFAIIGVGAAFAYGVYLGVQAYNEVDLWQDLEYEAFCQGTCHALEAETYTYNASTYMCRCFDQTLILTEYSVPEYYPAYE